MGTRTRTRTLMRWPVCDLPVDFLRRAEFSTDPWDQSVRCSDGRDYLLMQLELIAKYWYTPPDVLVMPDDGHFERMYRRVKNQGIAMRHHQQKRGNRPAGIVALVDMVPWSIEVYNSLNGAFIHMAPGATRMNVEALFYVAKP